MLNILSCIKERENYFIDRREDEWIEKLVSSEPQKEVFFITTSRFAVNKCYKQRDELLSKYHLAGIFELGKLYFHFTAQMILVYLIPGESATMKVSVFSGETFDKGENRSNRYRPESDLEMGIPSKYSSKFNSYIKEIENWINKGIAPKADDGGEYEFNEVETNDVDTNKLYPSYYTKQAMRLKQIVNKEGCMRLSDVADVFRPRPIKYNQEQVKLLKPSNFTYPLNTENLTLGNPTDIILHKGDIVYAILGHNRAYLYDVDNDEPIYASESEVVIRSKKILPEFLYLYLNSEVAKQLLGIISTGITIKNVSPDDLKRLPVPQQTLSDEEYKRDFRLLTTVESRDYKDYKTPEQVSEYYDEIKKIQEKGKEPNRIEDILNLEVAENMKVNDEDQLRSFLTDDMRELNTCFTHGAYKATLILAGSILEAILIDWLSEIDGRDYFNEDYIAIDRYTGRQKPHADLIDYIDAIKEIKRPAWMKEAREAHEIRKKRNLVHAKLGINSDEVNEETCREVIKYLEDVMETRGVKQTIISNE